MDEQTETPLSEELLDHIRRHDYDGQGKSQQQEADDAMWIVGYAVLAVGGLILAGIIIWIYTSL